MCGRFVLAIDPVAFQQEFDLTSPPELTPRYNIAPTQTLPVISSDAPREVSYYRWGLIPSWAKDEKIGSTLINARGETVEEKPSFRTAFKRRRCLVPSTGYYEWQKRDDGKQPMFIHLQDRPLFALAGLWEIWRTGTGADIRTFTIITTNANEFTQPIHDRMPVILRPADYPAWLAPTTPLDDLRALIRPYDSQPMNAYAVSKMVNRPILDSPELIEPLH